MGWKGKGLGKDEQGRALAEYSDSVVDYWVLTTVVEMFFLVWTGQSMLYLQELLSQLNLGSETQS